MRFISVSSDLWDIVGLQGDKNGNMRPRQPGGKDAHGKFQSFPGSFPRTHSELVSQINFQSIDNVFLDVKSPGRLWVWREECHGGLTMSVMDMVEKEEALRSDVLPKLKTDSS
jgi:hypothetical protein